MSVISESRQFSFDFSEFYIYIFTYIYKCFLWKRVSFAFTFSLKVPVRCHETGLYRTIGGKLLCSKLETQTSEQDKPSFIWYLRNISVRPGWDVWLSVCLLNCNLKVIVFRKQEWEDFLPFRKESHKRRNLSPGPNLIWTGLSLHDLGLIALLMGQDRECCYLQVRRLLQSFILEFPKLDVNTKVCTTAQSIFLQL